MPREGEGLHADRGLDEPGLGRVVAAEHLPKSVGFGLDAAAAAGALEGGTQLCACEARGLSGGGSDFEQFTGFGTAYRWPSQ
ncbi:hypothetical protein GCM10011579_033130 [Streptomyces albiflavescens]|uniref:Uncharacterized protein n=1 Tax=Streptomyces albiflavescens TaxID=1623582 RepID=A0A918D420_9ACTN|nr:hypothetical protein GCM10011579_033130 [Streptomyces albiflavescens]